MRSAFTFGELDGRKISARWPSVRAACATASPKFPPDAAMTPTSGTSEDSSLLNAPRGLNEPVCCVSSSFKRDPALEPERARLELEHRGPPHVAVDPLARAEDLAPSDPWVGHRSASNHAPP